MDIEREQERDRDRETETETEREKEGRGKWDSRIVRAYAYDVRAQGKLELTVQADVWVTKEILEKWR